MTSNIQNGAVNAKESAATYIDVSNKMYSLFLDQFTSRVERRFNYWKSIWEVTARPYHSAAVDETLRDGFDRLSRVLELTTAEVKTSGQNAVDASEKLLSYVTQLQDVSMNQAKGVLKTSLATVERAAEETQHNVAENLPEEVKHWSEAAANSN